MDLTIVARIARRFTGGFVLAFHGISPERFTALVECLGPFLPVPLGELVERAKRGRPNSGLFAITVDDGVGENVRGLAAVLQARQWPGTFYLPTDYLDGERMSFQRWHKVEAFLPLIYPQPACQELSQRMRTLMHTRPRREYDPVIKEFSERLVRQGEVEAAALEAPEPISWAEAAQMARSDLIRFESHGVSHTAVSALSEEEIAFEMARSRDLIAAHTGRECRHFAYPFGSDRSIGALAPAVARRYYDSAASMNLGAVESADPWLLPRIPFYETNSRAFARVKILLKCTRVRAAAQHGS